MSARGNRGRKPAPRARRIPARTTAALLAWALAATACAAGPAATHQARPTARPANPTGVALPQIPASRREHVPSALYGTMLYGPAPPGLPGAITGPSAATGKPWPRWQEAGGCVTGW